MALCERPTAGKCEPCASLDESHLLSDEEVIQSLSSELPLWQAVSREEERPATNTKVSSISRKFVAKNFKAAVDCLNRVGDIAEREGHHPDFVSEAFH